MLGKMTPSLKNAPQLGALAKCNAREELDSGNLNNELVNVPLTPLNLLWQVETCVHLFLTVLLFCVSQFSIIRSILGYENAIDIKKKKYLELRIRADMTFIIIRNIEIISSFQISTSLGVNSFC